MNAPPFLVLSLLLPILISGCGYDEPNPKAYPYQIAEVREYPADIQWIDRFQSDSLSQDYILTAHINRQSSSNERYFQIEAPLGSPVLHRYNLEPPTSFPRQIPVYGWRFSATQNGHTRWICYSMVTDTSQSLYLLDMNTWTRIRMLPDVPVPYDPGAGLIDEITASSPIATEPGESVFGILYPSSDSAWRLRTMQLTAAGISTLFDTEPGVQAFPVAYVPGPDSTDGHLLGTNSAPSSGKGNNRFHDTNSYVFCWDMTGRLVWTFDTGRGGGTALILSWNDNLLVIRSRIAFSNQKETRMWLLNAQSGAVLDSAATSGMAHLVRKNDLFPEFLLAQGTEFIFGREMLEGISCRYVPDVTSVNGTEYYRVSIPNRSGMMSVILATRNHETWIFNDRFKPICYYDGYVPASRWIFRSGTLDSDQYVIGSNNQELFVTLQLERVPWYNWWFHRYWRYLLVAVILPLVGVLLFVWYKHAKLRREKRAQEKLYQEKIRQLSKDMARENSDLKTTTQSYLHSDVCGTLLTCGRELEDIAKEVDDRLFARTLKLVKTVFDSEREIRTFSRTMIPPLAHFEYPDMLRAMVKKYAEFFTCICEIEEERVDFAPDVKLNLFQCIQDALVNVQRHAQASVVRITSHTSASPIRISIADNGVGFKQSSRYQRDSLGFVQMETRMLAHGGQLQVRPGESGGTMVHLILPVRRELDEPTGVTMLVPSNVDVQ